MNDTINTIFVPQVTTVKDEPAVDEIETETETATETVGVVVGCDRLNIRKMPNINAKIITTAKVGTELYIDVDNSTDKWYCVCTAAGIEGFCMKDYVDIKQ